MKNQTTRRILAILLALVLTLGLLPTSAFAARVADDEVQTTAPVEDELPADRPSGGEQAELSVKAGTHTIQIHYQYPNGNHRSIGSEICTYSNPLAGGDGWGYTIPYHTKYQSQFPSGYEFDHVEYAWDGNNHGYVSEGQRIDIYSTGMAVYFVLRATNSGGGTTNPGTTTPPGTSSGSGSYFLQVVYVNKAKTAYSFGPRIASSSTARIWYYDNDPVKNSKPAGYSLAGWQTSHYHGTNGFLTKGWWQIFGGSEGTRLYVMSGNQSGVKLDSGEGVYLIYQGETPATTYTLKFNGNGTTVNGQSTYAVTSPETTASSYNFAYVQPDSRAGYEFKGWATYSGATAPDVSFPYTVNSNNNNKTLYAVWQRINQVTLTYNGNGNTGGSAPTAQTVNPGEGLVIKNQGTLVRDGHTFLGWNGDPTATTADFAAGETISLAADTTLYAVWESDAPYVDGTTPTCTATVNKAWAGDLPENMRPQNVSFDYEVTYTANDVQQAYTESGTVAPGGTITMHKWSFPSSYTDEQKHPYKIHVKLTEKNAAVAGYNHVFGAQYPADASGFSGNTCTKSFAGDHLSGTISVKNTYTKITDTANYTVQWFDTLGNEIKAPETRPGTVDTTVRVTGADKTVEKYDFVAADSRNVTSDTLAESGTVLKLYFQPKKPTNEFLYNLGSFTLQCQDKTSHQTSQRLVARDSNGFYNVWSSGYAAYDDAVTKGEDSYTWSMTVHADQWLALYQNWHEDPVHTLTDDQAEDIILTFTWNEGTWELPDGAMPFTIKMEGHKTTYTWKDEGDAGHVWKTATVSDCLTAPTYDGTPPTKAADDDYTYTFDRWDGPATTDDSKTYTAVYTPTAIPKLEITKTALVTGSVKPGDEVRYLITVTNVGNTDVTGVVITDALDSNLEFEGAVGTGKIWDAAPVEGKYDFGERVLGSVNTDTSTITLTITATVADGVANGTTIPNVATVDCPNMPEDNKPSDDVNITVGPTNGTVTVKYVTDDETPVELGSVSYEAAIDADYDHSVDNDGTAIPENGSATAKSPKTITTEAGVTYAYDAIATTSALTGTVSDGLVITVVYAADTKGNPGIDDAGEPTDEPDGTPDKYQVKVTFHVVNGFWNDGANADVVEYLEKYTDGVMAADGVATLGDIIPGAGERPISNEYRAGNWDVTPAETTMISADTTYTYTYVAKGHYTVIWLDDDGSVLHPQETVLEGDAIPSKPIPTKEADDDYTYTFSGWDDDVDETTGDVTRTATYTATARPKATVTWVDHDGTVLEGPVTFNTDGDPEPAQTIDDPTEYEDDDNVYTFVNWTRAVDETTGNITHTATYDATPKYTVTWKDGDTTILEGEDKVKGVDDVPEFPGELPEAPEGKEFDRWGDPVVDDETHTITVPIVWKDKDALTVKWVDEDGKELDSKTFFKGDEEPAKTIDNPTKASDATYNYSFKEWVKTTDDQGNITYTASYDATRKSTGGGGGGGSRPVDPPEEDLGDEDVPLAELPMLNQTDHFAYIIGKPDGNVHPLGNITRAEVVTIFFRIMTEEARSENWGEINEFSDVTEGMWYNHAVCTAVNAGLIKGMPDGTFGGDRNITRAEFATIAARFLDTATQPAETFTDIEGHWAEADINRATVAGWIKGVGDGKFNPDAYITRAEVMTLVNRMLNRKFDETNTLADMVVWADNMDKDIWYYGDVQEATNDHEYERKAGTLTETWTKITEPRDWSELEK